jgi:hypothetical protein
MRNKWNVPRRKTCKKKRWLRDSKTNCVTPVTGITFFYYASGHQLRTETKSGLRNAVF